MTLWIQVSSGRGPEECCWVTAQVMQRILVEAHAEGLDAKLIKGVPGSFKNTFKSALISINGSSRESVFLRSRWQGTVQWIGQSPYRPGHKRKNWFVSVESFWPVPEKEIHPGEFKFETMRAQGPGGQHVNKTESCVRVRHLPTGIIAVASEERSQHCNRKLAMARIIRLMERKNQDARKREEQDQWRHHNTLVRGNAVRVFRGKAFKEDP